MDYNAAYRISASGMEAERMRLEVTAANLANMHASAASPERLYQPRRVILGEAPAFTSLLEAQATDRAAFGGVQVRAIAALTVPPRMMHEPGHPHADAHGMVAYPGIDHTAEMLNMMTALRAYEANVTAMHAARAMTARTLEIGGQ
jgi:flagellar basal-body rod protein FlgC